jgi:tetratricopeptide (TPR) repeat protein
VSPPQRPSAGSGGGGAPPAAASFDDKADAGVKFSADEEAARRKIDDKLKGIIGKDYFAILGVNRDVEAAGVKKAYFALAKEFHTDAFAGMNLGVAHKKLDHVFQTIQTAHATLTDAAKRGEYEAKLSFEAQGMSTDVAAILQAEGDLHKARILVDRGELGSALKSLEKVIAVMPKNDEVLGYQRYCTWYQSKNAATARETVKALEQHWKAAPGALALKEFQGWILMEIGELPSAASAFKKVLEIDPRHAGATRGSRQLQRKMEKR